MTEPVWLVAGDAMLAIAPDGPTIWLVSIDDPAARARAGAVRVTAEELAETATHADAGERLLRRKLAKSMLAVAAGRHTDAVVVRRSAAGAPIVTTPPGWHLSVAARWPDCAIGIGPYRLGVDIERSVESALHPDLLTELERNAPGEQAAAWCWAAKEAHAKWTCQPLGLDPATIETALPPLVTSRFGTTRCWLREGPGHVAAVCTA